MGVIFNLMRVPKTLQYLSDSPVVNLSNISKLTITKNIHLEKSAPANFFLHEKVPQLKFHNPHLAIEVYHSTKIDGITVTTRTKEEEITVKTDTLKTVNEIVAMISQINGDNK